MAGRTTRSRSTRGAAGKQADPPVPHTDDGCEDGGHNGDDSYEEDAVNEDEIVVEGDGEEDDGGDRKRRGGKQRSKRGAGDAKNPPKSKIKLDAADAEFQDERHGEGALERAVHRLKARHPPLSADEYMAVLSKYGKDAVRGWTDEKEAGL